MLFIGVSMVAQIGDYHRLVAIHRPLGILILVLAASRMVTRILTSHPPLPPAMSPSERFVATASERLLYALFFALPLLGWAMLSAEHYPIAMFGALELPPIFPKAGTLRPVTPDPHGLGLSPVPDVSRPSSRRLVPYLGSARRSPEPHDSMVDSVTVRRSRAPGSTLRADGRPLEQTFSIFVRHSPGPAPLYANEESELAP